MCKNFILFISFILVLALVPTSVTKGADPDLVGWWMLDETSGTIAYDSSDFGNDGTLVGDPQWVAGQLGGALDLDGAGDWVNCGNGASLTINSAITMAVWVKAPPWTKTWETIFAKGDDSYRLSRSSAGNASHFGCQGVTGSSGNPYFDGAVVIADNTWHHLAGTYDGTNMIIYVDGDEDGRQGATGQINTSGADLHIGENAQAAGREMDGTVDDVRLYRRALTEAEIEVIMLGEAIREARNPDPAHLAVDVPIDANLGWTRGDGTVEEEVYFGTDPGALPKVADIPVLPPFPPLYNPPLDLIASTTYYWQIVEVNGIDRFEGAVWEFTTVRGEAQPDYPFDGAVITGDGGDSPWTKLIFVPGATSVEYKGYFSEDYSKVLSRHADANLGPPPYDYVSGWEYTYFAGNVTVPPIDVPLVRGTRYYWTVDSNDAHGNTFSGDVWEFTIKDFYAFAPSPPNEAIFISTDVFLSWLPGFGVEDHDIYMGTSWEDVNNAEYDAFNPPPEFVISRSDPNYQASGLPYSTKFYWRVDQVNGRGPPLFVIDPNKFYKGDVWEFTTLPEGVGQIREDLWWGFAGVDVSLLYAHPNFPGSPSETRMLNSFNSGTDLGDNYGGMIQGWLHPAYSGDYTFWLCTDDHAELYLSTDDTSANMQLIAIESGWQGPLTWTSGGEEQSSPIPLVAGQKYYIRACWKEEGGGDHCQVAWQGPDQPLAPVNGSTAAIIPGTRLEPFVQLWAHDPDPRDWQYAVPTPYTLRWGPGDHAFQHDVYFGKDKDVVSNATPSSTGIYQGRIGPNSLGPIAFDAAEFYYWRVDEVNLAGPDPCVWKGSTWAFRTVGAAGGLLGLYYHWDGFLPNAPLGPDNAFQILVMSRIDPSVNWNWGDADPAIPGVHSPDPSINVNNFGCRWVGHVEAPVDANYTFYTTTDDGARLFIDGVKMPLVDPVNPANDSWRQQGTTEYGASVVLTAGLHDIEMHMYEATGGAAAQLRWSSIPTNPSDDPIYKQIIPPIWLWPPLFASGPRPPDGSTIDDRTPALEWISGIHAESHELYFSANFDDVNDRNIAVRQITGDPCYPYPAVPPLELGRTYYWLVDEVKSSPPAGRWDARTVWSFTISECLSLDNMEDYNDRLELKQVWRDGNADVVWGGGYPYLSLVQGGSSGSNLNVSTAVGSPSGATGPIPPTPLNYEAMVLYYDNDGWTYQALPGEEKWVYDAPYYSEIEANTVGTNSLDVGQTWDLEGVKSLSLSFQGHPISDGTYDPALWPVYTQYGRGRDIQGRHDEFYFFSKYPFYGEGSIQAHVLSVENTGTWAKAGVMIREKWTPYSKYAAVFMTPGQGVTFQYRDVEDGPTTDITKPGVFAPQYVRLVRNISGAFEAKHSDNSFGPWQDVNAPDTEPEFPEIPMGTIDDPNIYAGTAVSSYNANQRCAADFNDMQISPLPANWIRGNIGTNDPEQLYVALSDGTNTEVVEHDDANAATLTTWQEWNIALSDFTTVNPDGIQKVYIGLGDRAAPAFGGSGAIYVDDIRACPPRCVPLFAKPLYDIAQPYDCIVNELDLALVGVDWLLRDEVITTQIPSVGPIAQYLFEGNFLDSVGTNHGDPCESPAIVLDAGRGSNVVDLNGSNQWVSTDANAIDLGIDGNSPKTITAWAYTRSFNNGGIFDMGNYADGQNFCLRTQTTENLWRTQLWGGADMDFTYDSLNKWVHFALVDEGSQTTAYADGAIVAQGPRNLATAGTVPFRIGQYNVANYFNGRIDDVRIYNYGLSQEEVAYIAADGAGTLHLPILSVADVYQGETPGNQWINFKDYAVIADKYLEQVLWP